MPLPLLVIVGPTASGKTELAVALARFLGGEIVNADSVQIYRHFDIGSGKPSATQRAEVVHHLIDACEPDESVDAAQFAKAAASIIADIHERARRPIVCGGSFLWVRALLYGLAEAPPADNRVREAHRALVQEQGASALYARLVECDPKSAERLNANDVMRVSRALEVFELTGKPMSSLHEEHGFRQPRYAARLVGVSWPREVLDQRIHRRVSGMLEAGWVDEVRALLEAGHGECRAMSALGYRQIKEALLAEQRGGPSPDRERLLEAIYRKTRVFVRRQRTWLRDEPVEWLTPEVAEQVSRGMLPDDLLQDGAPYSARKLS